MRKPLSLLAFIGAALLATSGAASAVTCYVKFDRNDNVVYRDVRPPVDMSDSGIAARDAMRRRGEYLLFMETDDCRGVTFSYGAGVSGALSVDDIVSGYRTYGGTQREMARTSAESGASSAREASATPAKR